MTTNLSLFWWVPFGKVPEVDASELNGKIRSDSPPQILDVRTRREYRNGHIDGAVHIPFLRLRSQANKLPFARHKPVVAICLTAHRSIPAVRVLQAYGFKDVSHLSGGMVAWRKEGLPEEV